MRQVDAGAGHHGAAPGIAPTCAGRSSSRGAISSGLGDEAMRALRGDRISMVFQDPMTSLDPSFSIGSQVTETIRAHRDDRATWRGRRAHRAARRGRHPRRRSGATTIRRTGSPAACASAWSSPRRSRTTRRCSSPTSRRTALDVTIQAQILDLLPRSPRRATARRSCSSPTTSASSPSSATGSA